MYRVLVDDNFDYMDEDARWELGTFATADEARKSQIRACESAGCACCDSLVSRA